MYKIKILIDLDDVVENLSEEYNKLSDEDKAIIFDEQIDIDVDKSNKLSKTKAFFDKLKPIDGAIESITDLIAQGHKVKILTSGKIKYTLYKYATFFKKYMPDFPQENIIISYEKQYIKGDVLLDDNPNNLIGGDYFKLLFTTPENKDFDETKTDIIRVDNWKQAQYVIENVMIFKECKIDGVREVLGKMIKNKDERLV